MRDKCKNMELKTIWICGIGGVGGYFGGKIAHTLTKLGLNEYKIYFWLVEII